MFYASWEKLIQTGIMLVTFQTDIRYDLEESCENTQKLHFLVRYFSKTIIVTSTTGSNEDSIADWIKWAPTTSALCLMTLI
jgi:3-deoxy-D-manno-octulosonic-acid transferase